MLPNVTAPLAASHATPVTRNDRRGSEPTDAANEKPSQADPAGAALGALQDIPVMRLQDLPPEMHLEVFRYIDPVSIGPYAQALGPNLPALPEVSAAALRLEVNTAMTLDELAGHLRSAAALEPACRDQPLHQILLILSGVAEGMKTGPYGRVELAAHGPNLMPMVDGCRAALDGMALQKAERIRQECLQISTAIDMASANQVQQLQALVPSLHRLRRADVPTAAVDAIRIAGSLAASTPLATAAATAPAHDDLALACLDAARGVSPAAMAGVLHAGYQACIAQDRAGRPSWARTEERLQKEIESLPPALLHDAIPPGDDRFVGAVGTLLSHLPEAERGARFDAVLESLPPLGADDAIPLSPLDDMTVLLRQLPPEQMLSRFSHVARQAAGLDAGVLNRRAIFDALAGQATFAALPPQQVGAAIDVLIDAVNRAPVGVSVARQLLEALVYRIPLAPIEQRLGLLQRVREAQQAQPALRAAQGR